MNKKQKLMNKTNNLNFNEQIMNKKLRKKKKLLFKIIQFIQ